MIRALLIDDEEDAREALRLSIGQYCPEVQLMAICASPEEGLRAIQAHTPDLVFLDIQMPRMSGFELLQQLAPVSFEVVFVTAHDQYAIKAIRFSALDYLLKPVDVDDLIQAVRKVQQRLEQKNSAYQYQSVLHNIRFNPGKIDRLAVPSFEGIDFFRAGRYYLLPSRWQLHHPAPGGKEHKLISKNLKDFESLLAESGFCRVHHSSLINLKHVQKYVKGEGGYVILTDDYPVDISRRKKEVFLSMLDKL